jgi:hypothetical protein
MQSAFGIHPCRELPKSAFSQQLVRTDCCLSAGFKVHAIVLAACAALDQEQCWNGLKIGNGRMLMNYPKRRDREASWSAAAVTPLSVAAGGA